MEIINDYIFEYDFPVAEKLVPYQNQIVENYRKNLNLNLGNNVPYENDLLLDELKRSFYRLIEDEFLVSERLSDIRIFTYCQNKNFYISENHNHINSSTINGVFYINPPSSGGQLEYTLGDTKNYLQPKPNKIYLFPYWMFHKPLPQSSDEWRISVNLEYLCTSRAKHKQTGIVW